MTSGGRRRYQFRVAAMGLLFIVASFLLMLVGALPLAAGVTGGQPLLAVLGVATFGASAWLFVRCTRIAVVITPDGLVVRNLLRTSRLQWSQIADIRPQQLSGFMGLGPLHVVMTVGIADSSLSRIDVLATRTVVAGSGVRLFPLLAVLDVHAATDDFTVDHRLPNGEPLPGSPA